jgi:alpha-N-arabinofuranosidase
MSQAAQHMDALSLHWYTRLTRGWPRGSATEFTEEQWHAILQQALRMGELLDEHCAIMDRHDPERRVGLFVDEWGTWYDAEPGTNPAFLYQQNGLRDALVAAIHLNLFAHHAGRVRMANLAQTVNVLQALILTREDSMILTPPYHVFDMYQVHRNAMRLSIELSTPEYRLGDVGLPMIHASASLDDDGKRHLSVVNLAPDRAVELAVTGVPPEVREVTARVMTAETMTAHNTFESPGAVSPSSYDGFRRDREQLSITVPAKSVLVVALTP